MYAARAEPPSPPLTIDQLAQRTGVTTRNIRAYQAAGLLPPPERRGRVGLYGDEHCARLEVIRDLRARGLGLETIGSVLARVPGSSREELSAFAQAMTTALFLDTERATTMTTGEFVRIWGRQLTPETVERALRIGLYRRIDADSFAVLSPTIEQYGQELAALHVPLRVVLDLSENLLTHARALARSYVDLLIDYVLRPMLADGTGLVRIADFEAVAKRLRPLASGSVAAVFPVVLKREFDRALATLPKETRP